VLSVDLVANPATTTGLFEDETDGKKTTPAQKRTRIMKSLAGWQDSIKALSPPADDAETKESTDMDWKDIDLDGLKKNRPELLTALQESLDKGDELKTLQEELKTLKQEKAARELQEAIAGELKAAGLDPANKTQSSDVFLEDLAATADAGKRAAKIADRKQLVASSPAPFSPAPMQEATDSAAIPPVTAPLSQRLARFAKR